MLYKKASVFLLNLLRLFAFSGSGGRDHKGRAFRCNLLFLKKKQKDFHCNPSREKHPNDRKR